MECALPSTVVEAGGKETRGRGRGRGQAEFEARRQGGRRAGGQASRRPAALFRSIYLLVRLGEARRGEERGEGSREGRGVEAEGSEGARVLSCAALRAETTQKEAGQHTRSSYWKSQSHIDSTRLDSAHGTASARHGTGEHSDAAAGRQANRSPEIAAD